MNRYNCFGHITTPLRCVFFFLAKLIDKDTIQIFVGVYPAAYWIDGHVFLLKELVTAGLNAPFEGREN